MVLLPPVAEGDAVIRARVGLRQRLQVVGSVVLTVGIRRAVTVGNQRLPREQIPLVFGQRR